MWCSCGIIDKKHLEAVMEELIIMLRNVLIFVALAIPGYLLVKFGMLKHEQSGVLSKILMFLALPFLIFSGTVNNLSFSTETLMLLGIVLVIGIVYTFAMFFASKPLVGWEKEQKTNGMMRFCATFSNNGFLGIPLAMAVFGQGSTILLVVIIINIITNLLMYTLGIYLISGDKSLISWKKALLNPVLIAFVIGTVLNLIKIKEFLPEVVTYSSHFSNIVTPISMTVLGMKMGAIKFGELFKDYRLYHVSALKLIIFPLFCVGASFILRLFLPQFVNADIIIGVFISFAMPTAGLASTFSDNYNGDTPNAVRFTLGTTLFSTVTIPVLYWILNLII
jgi:predicted permease